MRVVLYSFICGLALLGCIAVVTDGCSCNTSFNYNVLATLFPADVRSGSAVCDWKGVICDLASGNITSLDLQSSTTMMPGSLPISLASLVGLQTLHFPELYPLSGTFPTPWCTLNRLVSLQVRTATGVLPACLSQCTLLQVIDFDDSSLEGTIPTEWGTLAALRHLHLSRNHLTGTLPPWLWSLQQLERVDVSNNQLTGSLQIAKLGSPNLLALVVASNSLSGTLPEAMTAGNIATLDLRLNAFNGTIPSQWGTQMPMLQQLYLDVNNLAGTLPSSLGALSVLATLSASHNSLSGRVPLDLWTNMSSLEYLALDFNQLEGFCGAGSGDSCSALFTQHALSRLATLSIRSNAVIGSIPTFLYRLPSLHLLDLSANQLSGTLPLVNDRTALLSYFFVQSNLLGGGLPGSFCAAYSDTRYFNAGNNLFHGTIPLCVGRSALYSIQLASNNFTGTLHDEWVMANELYEFGLSDNQLSGSLPPSWGALHSTTSLTLANNRLTGGLPTSWGTGFLNQSLRNFSIGGNSFCGPPPSSWSSVSAMASALQSVTFNGSCAVPLPASFFVVSSNIPQGISLNINGSECDMVCGRDSPGSYCATPLSAAEGNSMHAVAAQFLATNPAVARFVLGGEARPDRTYRWTSGLAGLANEGTGSVFYFEPKQCVRYCALPTVGNYTFQPPSQDLFSMLTLGIVQGRAEWAFVAPSAFSLQNSSLMMNFMCQRSFRNSTMPPSHFSRTIVVVPSQPSQEQKVSDSDAAAFNAIGATSLVVTLASVIASAAAHDGAILASFSEMPCIAPLSMASKSSILRFTISPFYDLGHQAVVLGNLGLGAALLLFQLAALFVLPKCQPNKWKFRTQLQEALRYPTMTNQWCNLLLPGLLIGVVKLLSEESDRAGSIIVAVVGLLFAVVHVAQQIWLVWKNEPVSLAFTRPSKLCDANSALHVFPSVIWGTRATCNVYGSYFSSLRSQQLRRWGLSIISVWLAAISAVVAASPIADASCVPTVSILIGIQSLAALMVSVIRPYRAPFLNVFCVLSSASLVGVLAAMLNDDTTAQYALSLSVGSLAFVRLLHDGLVLLGERGLICRPNADAIGSSRNKKGDISEQKGDGILNAGLSIIDQQQLRIDEQRQMVERHKKQLLQINTLFGAIKGDSPQWTWAQLTPDHRRRATLEELVRAICVVKQGTRGQPRM